MSFFYVGRQLNSRTAMKINQENIKKLAKAMRKSFFEKVYIGPGFKSTYTESVNEFRESTHVRPILKLVTQNT